MLRFLEDEEEARRKDKNFSPQRRSWQGFLYFLFLYLGFLGILWACMDL